MPKEIPHLTRVHKTVGYSHAVRDGNTVYISGQLARDINGNLVGPGDIVAQATQVYENLKNILEELGGSLKNIVRMTVYLTHHRFIEPWQGVLNKYFADPKPADTLLMIESLSAPEFLIEIEAIAVLGNADSKGQKVVHDIPPLTGLHKPIGYSHVSRAGKILYIAGQVAKDRAGKVVGPGDIEAQATQAYENLKTILIEVGGRMENIFKMTTYLTHHRFIEPWRAVRQKYFQEPLPPNTLLMIESLAKPDFLIEVEAMAELE